MTARPARRGLARSLRRYGWLLPAAALLSYWIINASRSGNRVEGCPEGCVTANPRRDGSLRVMSLNMLHGFPRFRHLSERLVIIAGEIERLDADIVCLQEVPWSPQFGNAAQYLAEQTGLNHAYLRANGNRWAILFEEGEAILSRYPLREVAFAELLPRAGLFEHRVVLEATAVTPWGDVAVFATHLTNGDQEVNRAQADSLMTFVNSGSHDLAIIAGDFNATEDSPQIQLITQRAADTYRVANPQSEGLTCCVGDLTSSAEKQSEKRIDYLFLLAEHPREVQVVDCQVILDHPFQTGDGWLWASDHAGLFTILSMPNSTH
ncbi:MAG: endonuclease/exonuclease/phosphatase family protein [Anaerolineae bacterium]|nr:endonuclease/exonuclease/phosphatase family protein [Anaerolineae bacterium]